MKKGKNNKSKTPVPPTQTADDQPSKKMLMLQKKMGKIGKWNLNATIAVTQDDKSTNEQEPPHMEEIPKISLINQN